MIRWLKGLGVGSLVTGAALLFGCNGDSPQSVAGNGVDEQRIAAATKYEAENATLTSPAQRNTNHSGYSGTGFVDGFYNKSGGQVAFTVSASTAGSYRVVLHYSAGNGTNTSMGLFVGTTRIKTLTCNATANWDTWANLTETVTLASGNNQIVFKSEASTSKVINLDYITIESATSYTITASAGANGSISPSGSVSVASGGSQAFTINPASGYLVSAVTVDGAGQGAITSYTFSNVTANHTISATFVATSTNYTITATAGANGTITPSGSVSVASGSSRQFTIAANIY